MARPLACNLSRDGYEAAAERVKKVMAHTAGPHVAMVDPDGGVRVTPRNEYRQAELDALVQSPSFVGLYNRQAPIEDIENDFLHWLRQLNRQAA